VTACHRLPSTTETFQRLDDVLGYLRGKLVVQLTVKRVADYQRTIAAIRAAGAEDFAFMEITPPELRDVIPALAGGDAVYYLINLRRELAGADVALAVGNPRAFMYEIDPGVAVGTLITGKLHPANVRAFVYDDASGASVGQLKARYDGGFDVVSAQAGKNAVDARIQVNQARGVTPP
jgi:hypothetical protein